MRIVRSVHVLAAVMSLLVSTASAAAVWRWSNPLPHGNNVVDMACHNGLAVQVAEQGQLYTSGDFVNWFPQNTHSTATLQAVTFLGGRLITTGENGTAIYSDDGASFVLTNLNTDNWLVGVAASSNLAVAVGDNAAVYTSPNGAAWHLQAPPPGVGSDWLLSVAYGAGQFVAVGEQGYVATSANGTNWTQRSSGLSDDLYRVTWLSSSPATNALSTSGFWAVSSGGHAIYSTNGGVAWHAVTMSSSTNILYAIAGNDSTRLLAGDQTIRLGTTDAYGAVVWPRQEGAGALNAPTWLYYSALWDSVGSSYWLAGDAGMLVQGVATNGGWAWQTPYDSVYDWLWDVTVADGLYVAVGDHARVMTSSDGVDWSVESFSLTNSVTESNTVFFSVGGTTNLLLTVGTKGSLAASPARYTAVVTTNQDLSRVTNLVSSLGVLWQCLPAPTTNDLHGLAVLSNKYFFAVGGDGAILTTTNATNWTSAASSVTTYLSSIETWSNGLVVVGDQGTILTSGNGVSWTKRTSATTNWLYRVRCLGGKLVAVGENGVILVSSNGINWASMTSGVTSWLNDVEMVTNTFYIVGTQGTLLASTNLTNWVSSEANTLKSLYAAATQNGQLIAVGIEGVIIRNQIVPILTPANFLSYSRTGSVNVFLVGGDTDQSFRLDSSTNLTAWTTNGPVLDILDSSGTILFFQDTGSKAPPQQFYRTTLIR